MYSNALYESWLKATYGLGEPMPFPVPRRNVPPLFALVPDPVAVVAKISAAATSTSGAASQPFLISPSLSRFERRFVHRQGALVCVERITDAQRNGSLVLAVPERELVEHGHSERLQVLVEHVLDRLRRAPVGDFARQVAVVAL